MLTILLGSLQSLAILDEATDGQKCQDYWGFKTFLPSETFKSEYFTGKLTIVLGLPRISS